LPTVEPRDARGGHDRWPLDVLAGRFEAARKRLVAALRATL
jgi:hypothetical protein